jgi:hypothetical protein
MRRTIITLAMVLICSVANAQQDNRPPASAVGSGVSSCAEFAEEYRQSPREVEVVYFAWAQGYMTGLNVMSAGQNQNQNIMPFIRDLLAKRPIEQQQYIRFWCSQHPLSSYLEAVFDLWGSLPLRQMKP